MKIQVILFCILSSTLSWCSEKDTQEVSSVAAVTEPIINTPTDQPVDQLSVACIFHTVSTMKKDQDAAIESILGMIEKLFTRMLTIEINQRVLKKRLDVIEADKKKS